MPTFWCEWEFIKKKGEVWWIIYDNADVNHTK